ncbi:pyridoxamine 5'-phosphate oxidase family protein [Allomuricauda sp. d1]|uniref:pyridoxamine 5'-phosphate oxidase family protein n=1 Tax=Allomuricauda sp. d1 TaxID=3136725 RepID=UPI0031D152B1
MIKNLEMDKCLEVLGNNLIGRIGYIFGQSPFIVPITYFHDKEQKCIISYSAEGHKMEAMRRYDIIALQVDEIDSIEQWKSVLVQGRFEELTGIDAKLYLRRFADGVREIMERKGVSVPKFIKDFSSTLENRGVPTVYKLIINDIIGKAKER